MKRLQRSGSLAPSARPPQSTSASPASKSALPPSPLHSPPSSPLSAQSTAATAATAATTTSITAPLRTESDTRITRIGDALAALVQRQIDVRNVEGAPVERRCDHSDNVVAVAALYALMRDRHFDLGAIRSNFYMQRFVRVLSKRILKPWHHTVVSVAESHDDSEPPRGTPLSEIAAAAAAAAPPSPSWQRTRGSTWHGSDPALRIVLSGARSGNDFVWTSVDRPLAQLLESTLDALDADVLARPSSLSLQLSAIKLLARRIHVALLARMRDDEDLEALRACVRAWSEFLPSGGSEALGDEALGDT